MFGPKVEERSPNKSQSQVPTTDLGIAGGSLWKCQVLRRASGLSDSNGEQLVIKPKHLGMVVRRLSYVCCCSLVTLDQIKRKGNVPFNENGNKPP